MSLNHQLANIQRTLGEHTGTLKSINKKLDQSREDTTKLFDQSRKSGERLAKLEQRADGFERQATLRGTISGGIISGLLVGSRMIWEWIAGR